MDIHLYAQRSPELSGADDLQSLAAISHGVPAAGLAQAMGEAGVVSDDAAHVYVDPAWLRRHGVRAAQSGSWLTDFEATLAFAESKGWVDQSGRVRAHVVDSPD